MPDKSLLTQLSLESTDFARLYQELQEGKTMDQTIRLAACGLMNAGKSALLNVLTGHIDKEYFETKAIRATKRVQTLVHNGIAYVDTPGIDANDEDEQHAWSGLINADIILFAHNLGTATLETIEIDFLKKLKARHPDIETRLLFVMTHAESASEQRQDRLDAITAILTTLFTSPIPMIPTSCPTYRKGVVEKKDVLIEHSGINVLLNSLKTLVERTERELHSIRYAREELRRSKLEAILDKAINKRKYALEKIKTNQSQSFLALQQDVNLLASALQERIKHC